MVRFYLIVLSLTTMMEGAAMADSHVAKDIAKAQQCANCHNADGFDLVGAGTDALEATMKSMRDGDLKHKPSLSNLADDDIAEIAKILNRGFGN